MNSKSLLAFLLFLFVSSSAFSQLNNTLLTGSIGQTAIDMGKIVRYDSNGNIVVAGRFGNTPDFDLGPGVFNIAEWSLYDIFVAKYSASGALIWAKGFTGPTGSQKEIADLIIDANNNMYLTGKFSGTMDFDPGVGQDLRVSNVSWNTFLIKMDGAGSVLWGHDFGSNSIGNEGVALDFDSQGNLLWTGYYGGTIDFDPSPSIANHTAPAGRDIFFAKYSPSGAYLWLKTISGSASNEFVVNIHTTATDEIFLTGTENNQIDFDPSANTATIFDIYGNTGGTYLAKYTSNGDFLWVKRYGQVPNTCVVNDSYLDKTTGLIYLSGFFQNVMDADPNPINSVTISGSPSAFSAYLLKLTPNGNLTWHYSLVSSNRAEGRGLALFQNQDVLWTGEFWGTTDFDNGTNTVSGATVGPRDVFALHISNAGNYVNHGVIGGNQNEFMGGVAINSSDQAVLTGSYIATADLDPTSTVSNYTALGNSDCFLVSMGQCATSFGSLTTQTCSAFTSPSGNSIYTQSGIYYDTLLNAAGCDSVVQIVLTIGTPTNDTLVQQSCSAMYTPSGSELMDSTGIYVDSLQNQLGCDSLITINFTLLGPVTNTLSISSCSPTMAPSGNFLMSSTGIYVDSLLNYLDCDSIETINFTLLPSSTNTISISSCFPTMAPSGNFLMSSSGIYVDSLLNYLDCDSIETINFTLTPLEFTIEQNSDSLWVSNSNSITYQWIDCATNTSIIGETNASFIPLATGTYAVITDNGLCADTSVCFPFTVQGGIGINEHVISPIEVYPNPANTSLTINLKEPTDLVVLSSDGKLIATLNGASSYVLNVTELENGVYFITAHDGSVQRFIKQE